MVQGLLNCIVLSQHDRDNQDTSECLTTSTENHDTEEIKSISSTGIVSDESIVEDNSKKKMYRQLSKKKEF